MTPVGSHTQNNNFATAQTVTVDAKATHILIHTTTQAVRITFDGTTPTTVKGMLIPAGAAPEPLPAPRGGSIKIIEVATTAVVDYQFYNIQA